MSLLNHGYIGDLGAKASVMTERFQPTEQEKKIMERREKEYRATHAAKEAVQILNFILNPAPQATIYGTPNSELARKVVDLCSEAIAYAHQLSKENEALDLAEKQSN